MDIGAGAEPQHILKGVATIFDKGCTEPDISIPRSESEIPRTRMFSSLDRAPYMC